MRAIRWSRPALRDLAAVNDHYGDVAPDYARRVEEAVLTAGRFLRDTPLAGSPVGPRGTRKWLVPRVPYILLYQTASDGIVILRLHHARENWR